MLGLDAYGSDSDSDNSGDYKPEIKPAPPGLVPHKSSGSLANLLPQPKKAVPTTVTPATASKSGLNLPAPKSTKSKRKEGPVKITVEALKPTETDDEPQAKRPRLDKPVKATGAGSSSLLNLLPAPKKDALAAPVVKPSVLGAASSGADHGVNLDASASVLPANDDENSDLSFLPPALRKPRVRPPPAIGGQSQLKQAPGPAATVDDEEDGTDFFGISAKSSSDLKSGSAFSGASRSNVSAAPQVKDYEPPPPTPFDPYPGYYQKPNGEWAAYDPDYYRKWWQSTQADANQDSSGREGKGWDGADSGDMESVDAADELKKAQHAELERRKGLTAPPKIVQGVVPATVKQKSGGVARSRHQLHTLLVDAYQNRAAIEEKLAEGRRNRKEAGNKYGF